MSDDTATASFRIEWHGQTLEAEVAVPTARVTPRVLLPMVQRLTDALVAVGEKAAAAAGEKVSCARGCAACCRMLVPVSVTEARHLAALVTALPEPRRSAVVARFADALRRLADAGMVGGARTVGTIPDLISYALDYIRLGITCPFLEDECCSVYADRPLACREFAVTSPAANCSDPTVKPIRRLRTPGFAMTALARLDSPPESSEMRWVPLVVALEWAIDNPDPHATDTGTVLFTRFMTALTKNNLPSPASLP